VEIYPYLADVMSYIADLTSSRSQTLVLVSYLVAKYTGDHSVRFLLESTEHGCIVSVSCKICNDNVSLESVTEIYMWARELLLEWPVPR
jgi:Ni,Fe-hydrogenase III component G